MSPRLRSALLLLGTFVLGIALGALALGAVIHHRHDRMHELHHRTGLVRYVMVAIEPRDEAQRRAILPHVEEAAGAAHEEMVTTHERLMELMDEMRNSLRPVLTEEQLERLESSLDMAERRMGSPTGSDSGPAP